MRAHLTKWMLAGSFMLAATAQAQTWESPQAIGYSSFSDSRNTCAFQSDQIDLEYGLLTAWAPATVYRVWQIGLGRPPIIHPRAVMLSPQGWNPSLWVCRSISGTTAHDCVDASDNDGIGTPEYATVPVPAGYYYIIVTTALQNTFGATCGPYALTVHPY
jgi:hypothetical protein